MGNSSCWFLDTGYWIIEKEYEISLFLSVILYPDPGD
jgi:hypothetical protein